MIYISSEAAWMFVAVFIFIVVVLSLVFMMRQFSTCPGSRPTSVIQVVVFEVLATTCVIL